MAVVRRRGEKFELRLKHRLLPKLFTATFDSETDARNYGSQLKAMLAQGVVPHELVARRAPGVSATLAKVIHEYEGAVTTSALDSEILPLLRDQIGLVRVETALDYQWCEDWVRSMKLVKHLAPGTIRKRVGALARMFDWYLRRQAKDGGPPLANPLRLLPKRYATCNEREIEQLASSGIAAPTDEERDRRLHEGEELRIVAALTGVPRPDRERPLALPDGEALLDLYHLLVNEALRLREAFTLRVKDIRLDRRTIHVRRSKTGPARDVPVLPAVYAMLERRVRQAMQGGPNAAIFPWWCNGADARELARITSLLSRAFGRAFDYADCVDLTTHDLRHEATCRWVLMRDAQGGWVYRTEELMRITGHKDMKMFLRYVSLRGSDLAARLWSTPP